VTSQVNGLPAFQGMSVKPTGLHEAIGKANIQSPHMSSRCSQEILHLRRASGSSQDNQSVLSPMPPYPLPWRDMYNASTIQLQDLENEAAKRS